MAELSKLFFMSAYTSCQLFQSSLASCFSRTDNKEVLAIDKNLYFMGNRKKTARWSQTFPGEWKETLSEWLEWQIHFLHETDKTYCASTIWKLLKITSPAARPSSLVPIPPHTHSAHGVRQELFCIDVVVITSVMFCEQFVACFRDIIWMQRQLSPLLGTHPLSLITEQNGLE